MPFSSSSSPPPSHSLPYTSLFRSVRPLADGNRRRRDHAMGLAGSGLPPYRHLRHRDRRPSDFRERQGGHLLRLGQSRRPGLPRTAADRKSTRLNSSHLGISYAVFIFIQSTSFALSTLHVALPICPTPP